MTISSTAGLFDPTILDDPYETYARLREQPGLFWQAHASDSGGMWMATRHAEVEQVLKDARLTKDARKVRDVPPDVLPNHMLATDPPDHTRLRGLVGQAFTPRTVERMEAPIRAIASTLLDRVASSGRLEFMDDFATPLPVVVIAQLLGVPPEDHDAFRAWSTDFVDGSDFANATPEHAARAQAAIPALAGFLSELVAKRRANPADDLISHLIAAEDEGGRLQPGELISNLVLLVIAGHETTVNLLGNGLLALLRHPEQLAFLRAHPDALPSAIEEMLRFDAPVQRALFRAALEDVEIGGQVVRRGEQVSAVIGAGNRDPLVFAQPDSFLVTRMPNRHLSFGRGIHFCLGAPLAKLEARVAFEELVRRFEHLELAAFERRPSTMFRGLRHLHVRTS
ncbi:cytochrome P450 family protein [Deinococcus yavapaiensis]|uniref:Cytochrome P450 n=1 Tax=Deinococcus yavapaiensis KR-236 TaxID=694435 RepID=A0A318S075_9DEIO|nr:cytochrome P450 [Deinococcus yavapaiensis]PYE49965.1 cytochrome P450 [Deinococcus yavapaiensis KR-236]